MVYFVRFWCVARRKDRERKRDREMALACFNVLNHNGVSGTHQVATRIPCAAFLSTFIWYLKNQYCDLETQRLDGPSKESLQIIYLKNIYSGAN